MLGFELLQLGHHVGVHTAGNLGLFHQFVGFGESEIVFDSVASIEQSRLVVALGGIDSGIEEFVDVVGQLVDKRVEGDGEGIFLQVVSGQFAADTQQLGTYLAHGSHVDLHLYTQFLAEDVEQLDSRSCRTATKVPDVGIENVDPVNDSHQRRGQTVTRRTVGVEIDGHLQGLFQFRHQRGHPGRINQTGHIFQGHHLGTQLFKTESLLYKVFIGKDGLGQLLAEEGFHPIHEGDGIVRVDRIAHGTIGDGTHGIYLLDRRFHVVQVVEGIKYTHDSQAVGNSLAVESVEYRIGIRCVSKQIAATRKSGQIRSTTNSIANGFEASPRTLVQIAHHRIGYCTAPNFHGKETGILIIG